MSLSPQKVDFEKIWNGLQEGVANIITLTGVKGMPMIEYDCTSQDHHCVVIIAWCDFFCLFVFYLYFFFCSHISARATETFTSSAQRRPSPTLKSSTCVCVPFSSSMSPLCVR
jgi:hypothetical protein